MDVVLFGYGLGPYMCYVKTSVYDLVFLERYNFSSLSKIE